MNTPEVSPSNTKKRLILVHAGYFFVRYWLIWKPLRIWIVALLLVSMVVDGVTHLLSDGNGLWAGFRYDNAWLAALTHNVFPDSFYRGDALGSFNSLMRFFTGVLSQSPQVAWRFRSLTGR